MWPFRTGEARRGTYPLAVFPLKAVLFPGGVLPIKVFEQRYVELVKSCLKEGRPFGVCLITQGEEVATAGGTAPEIAPVGTLARIVDWDVPQLGIMHVATRGETRFQVRSRSLAPSGLVTAEVAPLAAVRAVTLIES